jgi:hypothetical protein
MHWIRPVGSALALLLLMTSIAAAADSSVEQVPNNVRPSLATIENSFRASVAAPVSLPGTNRTMAALHRLANLTGGHSISAGIGSGEQVLGVAKGHVVVQRWTDFHVSIGLLPSR